MFWSNKLEHIRNAINDISPLNVFSNDTMLLLAVFSSDAIFPSFLLHYVYPGPHKTPVISDHSAFLINTFLNCAHSTFSLAENFSSVHSFTAAILFGSSFRSFSPFPSTLPVFASSLLNTSSKSFRANPFGVFFGSCSTFFLRTYTPRLGDPISIVDCFSACISLQGFCNWFPGSVLFCGRKGVKEDLTSGLFVLKDFGWAGTEGRGVTSILGSLYSKLTSASSTDL